MTKEKLLELLDILYELRSASEDRDTYAYYDKKCYALELELYNNYGVR